MSNSVCTSCGAPLDPDGKFCPGCGASVMAAAAPMQSTPPAPPPPPPPPQYQQPVYQQPVYQQPQPTYRAPAPGAAAAPVLSVGSYIGMMLLACLPVVGFILLLVWAFGSTENPNKKNYARAVLIISVIALALYLLIFLIAGGAIAAIMSQVSY